MANKTKEIRCYAVKDGIGSEQMISNDLKSLQEVVGGYVTTVRIRGKITILCDEDASLKGKKVSAMVFTDKGPQAILGDFLVCNMGSNFYSLSDKDLDLVKQSLKVY